MTDPGFESQQAGALAERLAQSSGLTAVCLNPARFAIWALVAPSGAHRLLVCAQAVDVACYGADGASLPEGEAELAAFARAAGDAVSCSEVAAAIARAAEHVGVVLELRIASHFSEMGLYGADDVYINVHGTDGDCRGDVEVAAPDDDFDSMRTVSTRDELTDVVAATLEKIARSSGQVTTTAGGGTDGESAVE